MTETVVSSASKEVVIGFERPFVIIGERINPTGRKILAAEMAEGKLERGDVLLTAAGQALGEKPFEVLCRLNSGTSPVLATIMQ